MIRAGVGYSTARNPRSAAAEATAAALAQAGLSSAIGALCFATPAYGAAYPMILRTVAAEAHTREVAGCSSTGVIAGETEIESGHALAVLVFGGRTKTKSAQRDSSCRLFAAARPASRRKLRPQSVQSSANPTC